METQTQEGLIANEANVNTFNSFTYELQLNILRFINCQDRYDKPITDQTTLSGFCRDIKADIRQQTQVIMPGENFISEIIIPAFNKYGKSLEL